MRNFKDGANLEGVSSQQVDLLELLKNQVIVQNFLWSILIPDLVPELPDEPKKRVPRRSSRRKKTTEEPSADSMILDVEFERENEPG